MKTGQPFESQPFGGSNEGRDPFGGAGPAFSNVPFGGVDEPRDPFGGAGPTHSTGFTGGSKVPYYNKPAGKASLRGGKMDDDDINALRSLGGGGGGL